MAVLSVIAAIDENNAIGKKNQLLCHLPNDLKYFKSVTMGHTVIMGRKTYESLPNGALPNRRNIVLSKSEKSIFDERCEIVSSLDEAVKISENEDEVFIIGGGSVYKEAINRADRLYITYIHNKFDDADTYFPLIDKHLWNEEFAQYNEPDEKNKFPHTFIRYVRTESK